MICIKCPTCNAKCYGLEEEIVKCLRCNTPFYPEDEVEIKSIKKEDIKWTM